MSCVVAAAIFSFACSSCVCDCAKNTPYTSIIPSCPPVSDSADSRINQSIFKSQIIYTCKSLCM
ncbi:unnamed protein product [Prunus brigantina]